MPPGTRELRNSYGGIGYGGPQPPQGSGPHMYVVTLYALGVPRLNLPDGASLADFQAALKGRVLAEAETRGFFGR